MKITKLTAFKLPEATVLRLETDSGLRGYGECRTLAPRELLLLRQVATTMAQRLG